MPNVNGNGNTFNLPNYSGVLFSADPTNTPFFTMAGGLTEGGLQTEDFEFAVDSEYSHEPASQPGISEAASLTAPKAVSYVRSQNTNVTQIFQEKVAVSYEKLSNRGRMSGLNTAGQANNAPNELEFQKARALEKIARDIEYTCLNGVYSKATDVDEPNKTRGMLTLCSNAVTIAAAGAALTKAMLQQLFKEMYNAGATFSNVVLWTNSHQKQIITGLYGYAPNDRNIGGLNIKQIETDFGNIGVALNRYMPSSSLLAADMSVVKPVFQPVPDKGNFFYEELSKVGAAEEGQIYGKFGLNHGPAWLHGSITGLATA